MSSQPSSEPVRPTWPLGLDRIAYGGDYNPEQWPEEVWKEDVTLMREAGVNLVSVGIFSWALLEPREGEFDFGWLDRLLELLHDNGIRVDLGTPTASPPAWFFAAHPDARVVTRDGTPLGFGSRGMAGPSHPAYRAAAVRIADQLARRYGRHPAVALWHVHNEYGAPVSEDYSPASAGAFRAWLQGRYGTLDALNAAWGTAFWGQRYGDWAHVDVPAVAPSVVNPAQRLDFARFTDDALRACFVAERDAIRAHSDVPVTTNFMTTNCPSTDLWKWADEVDVVSNDHYLTAADPRAHVDLALAADLTRSLARGRPWILMEHSTSAVNWQPRNIAKRPGEMARNALSHLGRGSDAILFFQWRASRSGAEKFHSAMLPHAGTTSRVWREVRALGADLGRLDEVRGSTVRADVALLWDWESFWAQDLEWRPSVDLDHRERVRAYYERLWRDGLTVDLAHPGADLSGYRLVVAPASYLLTAASGDNLSRYVAQGGTLVVSYFSGIVDEHDAVHPDGYGAPLRTTLGVSVEEFLPLREGETVRLAWDHDGERTELVADVWADDLVLEGADVVATYLDGPAAGRAAVTRHRHGAGTGWYVSTRLDVDALAHVLRGAYADAGLTPAGLPDEVEVVRRDGPTARFVVAINHADAPVDVPADGTELLTGTAVRGRVTVPAGGVAVVREHRGG
ncbi:beta-galactosidase [Cellulomonas fimi]|uniref:Beta-galactosidase n=1 Tax=Cellulomonas fimi (strain ATCC 484 / DSM 20113 / JCM 1341 / CCUG 24087 / LMG 16345 / NBRC 15513 / NCIMB 8980 / NCTC 7547 / NRS-133) TaxID=590998 RepID=F4H8A9_CELFA|nr:beta-galactosidase [Cellulomonas fimi]AEE44666.1 Beta-galactosidase [Cellulomonas fimi ATCC 484]NNH07478.1 beta-galactosidase [Cellulomonas fimi]VEH26947.1 Beta-galactosidase [Cellulomonas fimi]